MMEPEPDNTMNDLNNIRIGYFGSPIKKPATDESDDWMDMIYDLQKVAMDSTHPGIDRWITKKGNACMPPQDGLDYSVFTHSFSIYRNRRHIITIRIDERYFDISEILKGLNRSVIPVKKKVPPEIEIIDVNSYDQPLCIKYKMPRLIESGIIFLPITDQPSSILKTLYQQIHGSEFPMKHWKDVQHDGIVMIHQQGGFHVSYMKDTGVMHIWQVGVLPSTRCTGVFRSLNEAFLRTLDFTGKKTYTVKIHPKQFSVLYGLFKKKKLKKLGTYEKDNSGNEVWRFEIYVK